MRFRRPASPAATPLAGAQASPDEGAAARVAELEARVRGVEERWGPLHPQAGRAHLLLYHACRHRALAPAFAWRAQAALGRAYAVMRHNSQAEERGQELVEARCMELLRSILPCPGGGAGEGGGGPAPPPAEAASERGGGVHA